MDADAAVSAHPVLIALDAPRSHPPPALGALPCHVTRAGPPPVGPVRSTPERTRPFVPKRGSVGPEPGTMVFFRIEPTGRPTAVRPVSIPFGPLSTSPTHARPRADGRGTCAAPSPLIFGEATCRRSLFRVCATSLFRVCATSLFRVCATARLDAIHRAFVVPARAGHTFANAEPEAIDFSSASKKDTDSLSQWHAFIQQRKARFGVLAPSSVACG
jgi:hypothetical protein